MIRDQGSGSPLSEIRRAYAREWSTKKVQRAVPARALLPLLDALEEKAASGIIEPLTPLKTHSRAKGPAIASAAIRGRKARVGVLPLSANPPHWGHFLMALSCVDRFPLDCLVFLVQRRLNYKVIPRNQQTPVRHRFGMLEAAVKSFFPVLRNTDVATRNLKIGQTALYDLAALNDEHAVEYVAIWGSESCDRMGRIMRQMRDAHARNAHRLGPGSKVSMAFVSRTPEKIVGGDATVQRLVRQIDLNVPCGYFAIDDLPVISSTSYRTTHDPSIVPRCVHKYVLDRNLYGA